MSSTVRGAEDLTVRDLVADDHETALAVRTRSFGPLPSGLGDWWRRLQDELIEQRRVLGVFDGDRLAGTAKIRPFTQSWGGRPVPMAGVAGVVVAPEYRNRGVASLLLSRLAARGRELGDAVSALYPAAVLPYRRNGYEIAGTQTRLTVETRVLRAIEPGPTPPRPVGVQDVDDLLGLQRGRHERTSANGAVRLSRADILAAIEDTDAFAYRTDDGFVLYEWHHSDLVVSCLVAASEESARSLWSLVGSGASAAAVAHAYVAPDDPLPLLLPEEPRHDVQRKHWMFRVLDPVEAVRLRGFSAAVEGRVAIDLEDPMQPDVSGTWTLEVAGGRGSLVRSRDATAGVSFGPRGLAAWYAGTPMGSLRATGLAVGGSEQDDAILDAATGIRPAYLLEYF